MTARETALRILHRLEESELHADWALHETLEQSLLGRRDRALVTELVNGVTRWLRYLDWILDGLLSRNRLRDLPGWIRSVLRMGLYQILFLERIPPAAATDQSVLLAKKFGHPGTVSLVNGVLRSAVRSRGCEPPFPPLDKDPVGHIGLRYSHPDWMVKRWLDRYGREETIALCRANNRVPQSSVRRNTLKVNEDRLLGDLKKDGIEVRAGKLVANFYHPSGGHNLAALEAFRRGWFQIQDESTGLAVLLLSPQTGEVIVDLCSAPGGKTGHIADLMDDSGIIAAVDRQQRRLMDLVSNCRRLGIRSVYPIVGDGRTVGFRPVDRVLVDAPCSGLGVVARRVDLRWRRKEEDIARLAELQLQLAAAAADLLKPGGVLVYSTCSIEDVENEEVVERLLAQRNDLHLDHAASFLPAEVVTGMGFSRTFPHRHGLDGTFAARFKKIVPGELK